MSAWVTCIDGVLRFLEALLLFGVVLCGFFRVEFGCASAFVLLRNVRFFGVGGLGVVFFCYLGLFPGWLCCF